MRRFAAVCLAAFLLLCCSCRENVNPDKSRLLDDTKAHFIGDSAMKEMPGKTLVWDAGHVLLAGRRKPADADKTVPYHDFLWLVDRDGKLLWDLAFDSLGVRDLAILDSTEILALVTAPREHQASSSYELWRINRVGEILSRTRHAAPDGLSAARLTAIGDQILLTCWKQNADSSELICTARRMNAKGDTLGGVWDYPAEKLHPLPSGGFLAERNRQSRDGEYTLRELARLRADGSVVWTAKSPLDTANAGIMGVAETADGALLLTGHRASLYEPIVAKFSAEGKLLWSKRPPEMEGYSLYNLTPRGGGRFLVCAQKSLTEGRLPSAKGTWDCLAAFMIDADGNVLDSDILPAHWTMPVGGVHAAGDRCVFTGVGGADCATFMNKWDLAFYVM